jgi:hypothetical protein
MANLAAHLQEQPGGGQACHQGQAVEDDRGGQAGTGVDAEQVEVQQFGHG